MIKYNWPHQHGKEDCQGFLSNGLCASVIVFFIVLMTGAIFIASCMYRIHGNTPSTGTTESLRMEI